MAQSGFCLQRIAPEQPQKLLSAFVGKNFGSAVPCWLPSGESCTYPEFIGITIENCNINQQMVCVWQSSALAARPVDSAGIPWLFWDHDDDWSKFPATASGFTTLAPPNFGKGKSQQSQRRGNEQLGGHLKSLEETNVGNSNDSMIATFDRILSRS